MLPQLEQGARDGNAWMAVAEAHAAKQNWPAAVVAYDKALQAGGPREGEGEGELLWPASIRSIGSKVEKNRPSAMIADRNEGHRTAIANFNMRYLPTASWRCGWMSTFLFCGHSH